MMINVNNFGINYLENKNRKVARFFLEMTWHSRPGPSFDSYFNWRLLKGDMAELVMHKKYDYPTTHEQNIIIVPLTNIVILECSGYEEMDDEETHYYMVFLKDFGWIRVNEAPIFDEKDIYKLTNDELRGIINDLPENEKKYVLFEELWTRPGPSYDNERILRILEGDVVVVELEKQYDYPTTNWSKVAIIPLDLPTVLKFDENYDLGTNKGGRIDYALFTEDGWKEITAFSW